MAETIHLVTRKCSIKISANHAPSALKPFQSIVVLILVIALLRFLDGCEPRQGRVCISERLLQNSLF